jgi:glycosyltransferase involved in cell wall biosynthesis
VNQTFFIPKGSSTTIPYRILYVYSGKAKQTGAGLDLVVRQEVQALANDGHHIVFLARGRVSHPSVNNLALPATPANLISFLSSKHYYNAQNRFFSQLGAWVTALRKFDAVIGWTRQSRNLFRAANALGIPCFLNCPGAHYNYPLNNAPWENRPWPSYKKHDLDEEFRRADVLLTTSQYAADTFLANGIPPSKIVTIGRGADTGRFCCQPREPFPFRVVFFGSASERKGIFQAIAAWQKAALQNSELWIIGNIPKEIEPKLRSLLPVNARVFGHRNDAEKLLSQCHVQLLPTRREGMAKSLIEGAACGLVTLTTLEAGFPVQEGETGYFINRDDIDGIAVRLRQLAEQPEMWKHMSQQSANFVCNNLTWEKFRSRFLDTFHSYMSGFDKNV